MRFDAEPASLSVQIMAKVLRIGILMLVLAPAVLAGDLFSVPPPAPPTAPAAVSVPEAIEKGVKFLWSQQDPAGNWDTNVDWVGGKHPLATTSMACYALLESGVKPDDPKLKKALDWLEKAVTDPAYRPGGNSTYTLGFRTQAWLLANNTSGNRYENALRRDVERLVASTADGGYDYVCTGTPAPGRDNSNGQFGLYAAWAGKLGHIDIEKKYWEQVLDFWMKRQNPDGGWGYFPPDNASTISMAEAGVASLYVCFDTLYGPTFVPVGVRPPPINASIDRGMDYLDRNFPASLQAANTGYYMYYHLFGIQRASLASGRKRFGGVDWYDAGVRILLPMQKPDGSWGATANGAWRSHWLPGANTGTDQVWTAYALMFLARGQRAFPVVHLKWGEGWDNRPHALPNFYLWLGHELERKFRLEVVSFADPVQDFGDSKILFITGHQDPGFTEAQLDRLRTFVQQGGIIFSVTEGNGEAFRKGIRNTYKELFPWSVLMPMSPDHPIQSIGAKLKGQIPIEIISDGSRVLALHCDYDLTRDWQANQPDTSPLSFQLAENVYLYSEREAKRATTNPSISRPSVLTILGEKQLKAWGSADEPLARVVADTEKQIDGLQGQLQDALRATGPATAKALGQLAKAAAGAGKVAEAMALIDARKALERGESVNMAAIKATGIEDIQRQEMATRAKINEEFAKKFQEVSDQYESAMWGARQLVGQRLQAFLSSDGGRAEAQEVRKVLEALHAEVETAKPGK